MTRETIQITIYIPPHVDNFINSHIKEWLKNRNVKLKKNTMINVILREHMERTQYADQISVPISAGVAEWLYWRLGPLIQEGDYNPELEQPIKQWFKMFQDRVGGLLWGEEVE